VFSRLESLDGVFAEFRGTELVIPEDLHFVPFHRIYEEQYAVYWGGEWDIREFDSCG